MSKVSLPEQPADVALLREAGASIAQNQSVSAFVRARRRFLANRMALAALIVLSVMIALALGAPLIARYVTKASPTDQHLLDNFEPITGWAPTSTAAMCSRGSFTAARCRWASPRLAYWLLWSSAH
jgi:hypothetical protein